MMDWTGEYLIRSAPSPKAHIREAQRRGGRLRIADAAYIEAQEMGLTRGEAATHLGVSRISVWAAAKRLGLRFKGAK